MTVDEYIKGMRAKLAEAGYDGGEASWIVRDIFDAICGWSRNDIVLKGDKELEDPTRNRIDKVIADIQTGMPEQYALGRAVFMGMDFKVTPDTLIPRPETEQLVDMIADSLGDRKDVRIKDIGTGSGCIAIGLARHVPFSDVTASDISSGALEVAGENATRLKAKVKFVQEDILKASSAPDSYDVIVSNPPYITEAERSGMAGRVKDFEPSTALFVPDGEPTLFYKAISHYAYKSLVSGGMLWFEINPMFATETLEDVQAAGFSDVELIRDERGKQRFIKAVK